jgi:hypothetical protein
MTKLQLYPDWMMLDAEELLHEIVPLKSQAERLEAIRQVIWIAYENGLRDRGAGESMPVMRGPEGPHCGTCGCGSRYDDKRDIASVIAHLRFGDPDGDDHEIAADELERLMREIEHLHKTCDKFGVVPARTSE